MKQCIRVLGIWLIMALVVQAESTTDFQPSPDERAVWLDEAKFGLFIHWGLYSILEQGEWVMHQKKIPVAEYAALADTFNPVKFDADTWVRIAKNAGMKYITITSKHHDGFALFDSEASGYNVEDATPFKRDIIRELKEACDREGIRLGLYYSHAQDWYHPGGARRAWDQAQSGDFLEYLEKISLPQVRELLNQYQPDILWFDTPHQMTPALARRFTGAVREANPETLVNSRLLYHGYQVAAGLDREQRDELREIGVDFLSYRDRTIPKDSPWPYWETCMTLSRAWGINAQDEDWKSPKKVVQQLVEVVSKGGSFLLNVGPTAAGEIPAVAVRILEEVGQWLKINGEAVYGAEPTVLDGVGVVNPGSLKKQREQERMARETGAKPQKAEMEMEYTWLATGRDDKIYLHVFEWPHGPFAIEKFEPEVTRAYLLSDPDTDLDFGQEGGGLTVNLPAEPGDPIATVLCLVTRSENE